MLRSELIHSCSYGIVADAAVRSLGCKFQKRVEAAARCEDSDRGKFAASLVCHFAESARAEDWKRLECAMAGDDMPLLSGFRYIVENMLETEPSQSAEVTGSTA